MDAVGVYFRPDDRDLITYLQRHVHGRTLASFGAINKGIDPYSCQPEKLPNVSADGSSSYYYSDRTARDRRTIDGSGGWKCTDGQKPIYVDGQIIGYKRKFRFKLGPNGKNSISTKWVMEEYTLDRDTRSHGPRKAICKLRVTAGNQSDEIGQASTSDAVNEPLPNYTNVSEGPVRGAAYWGGDELPVPEFNMDWSSFW